MAASDGRAHLFRLTADAPLERAVDSLGAPLRVVFSPSGSAALVGAPVDFGFAVMAAYVAPRLDSVFVMAASDGRAHLFRLTADAPPETAVDSLGAPLRLVFSPSGTAAALYSPGSVQVIKGLPDAP